MFLCELRGLDYVVVSLRDLDLEDAGSLRRTLEGIRPWAVVDTSKGPCDDLDDAPRSHDPVAVSSALASACAEADVRLLVFSSDRVFDGAKRTPYVESDPVRPLAPFVQTPLLEAAVLERLPEAMVVRTGTLFRGGGHAGTSSENAPRACIWATVRGGGRRDGLSTSMPDLVNVGLDLLLDGIGGVIHLSNRGAVSLAEFGRRVAEHAGLDGSLIVEVPCAHLSPGTVRSGNSALESERAWAMPSFEDALARSVPRMLADLRSRAVPYLS